MSHFNMTLTVEVFYMSAKRLADWLRDGEGNVWYSVMESDLRDAVMQIEEDQDLIVDPDGEPDPTSEREEAIGEVASQWEGWYWWTCSPGCMPENDPCGPFSSEAEALLACIYDDPTYVLLG